MKFLVLALVTMMSVNSFAKSANDLILCEAEIGNKFYTLKPTTEPHELGYLKVEAGSYTVMVSSFQQSYGISVITHIEESTLGLEVSTGSSVINPKGVPAGLVAGLKGKGLPRIGVYCGTK